MHEIVSRASQEDLMLFYNLPAFADKDTDAFLRALARASGLIKKVRLLVAVEGGCIANMYGASLGRHAGHQIGLSHRSA